MSSKSPLRSSARLVVVALVAVLAAAGLPLPATAGSFGLVVGTVSGPYGLAASTIDVNLMRKGDFGRWESVGYDSTDREGRFEIWASPGTYRLWFKPYLENSVYLEKYYPDADSAEVAADIVVTADSTQEVFTQLDTGPHAVVSGTAVGTDGAPLPDVDVGFWSNAGSADSPWWQWRFLDRTDSAGRFHEVVRPGTYRVSYRRPGYEEIFFGGAAAVEAADDVVLADGASAELNAVVKRATRLQGSVLAAESRVAIPGTRVHFYRNTGSEQSPHWSLQSSTSPNVETGAYTQRVPAGVYLVRATDPYGEYLAEYYGLAFTTASATPVTVQEEAAVTGINIRMTKLNAPKMTAVEPPTVGGTPYVGATLTATDGTWSPVPGKVTYQWLSDGTAIAGATGRAYQPTAADLGRRLSVRTQAYTPGRLPAVQTSPATTPVQEAPETTPEPTPAPEPAPAPDKAASTTRLRASVTSRTVRLVATVTAALPVTGRVKVYRGTRLLRRVTLTDGKVVVRLTRQPRGTRRYKAVYTGSPTLLRSSRAVRVTV